jgi:hypothetical protein
MKIVSLFSSGLIGLSIAGAALSVEAASGVVSGRLRVHNLNSNYCNDVGGQNCFGSTYLKSAEFDQRIGVRFALVELWNSSGRIGQGSTGDDGRFKMNWSASSTSGAYLKYIPDQKDGAFHIRNSDGSRPITTSSSFSLVNGTTTSNPQQLNGNGVGNSSGSPWSGSCTGLPRKNGGSPFL